MTFIGTIERFAAENMRLKIQIAKSPPSGNPLAKTPTTENFSLKNLVVENCTQRTLVEKNLTEKNIVKKIRQRVKGQNNHVKKF